MDDQRFSQFARELEVRRSPAMEEGVEAEDGSDQEEFEYDVATILDMMRIGPRMTMLDPVDFRDEVYPSTALARQLVASGLMYLADKVQDPFTKVLRAGYVICMLTHNEKVAFQTVAPASPDTGELATSSNPQRQELHRAVELKARIILMTMWAQACAQVYRQVHEDIGPESDGDDELFDLLEKLKSSQTDIERDVREREEQLELQRQAVGFGSMSSDEVGRQDDRILGQVAVALRPLSPLVSSDPETGRTIVAFHL